MKGLLVATVLGLGLLGAAAATAGTAKASGDGDRRSYGGAPASSGFGVVIIGSPYQQERRHQRPDFFDRPPLKMWERPPNNLWQRPSHNRWEQPRYDRRHADTYKYKHKKAHKYANQWNGNQHGQKGYQAMRPCHQSSKIGFDDHGRRARIGGVLCYDPYGRPYIVHGSRFIIQYF